MTNHCTHQQCQALKEIGFDMPVRDYYENDGFLNRKSWPIQKRLAPSCCLAPTRSEVLQWAREKKGIDGWVEPYLHNRIIEYCYKEIFLNSIM